MWQRARWAVLAVLVVALCGEAVSAYLVERSTSDERSRAGAAHARLEAELEAGLKAGYTESDLGPGRASATTIAADREPLPPWERPNFYRGQAARYQEALAALKATEAALDANAKQDLDQQVAAVRAGLQKARAIDVIDDTVTALSARFEALVKEQAAARSIVDLRKSDGSARGLAADVAAANDAQAAENAQIQQAASALQQQVPEAVRKAGTDALAQGRNEATVAAYEARPGRFGPIAKLMAAYGRMERYGPRLSATDPAQLALAAAAVQRYAGQVHDLLYQNMGPKHVVVSFEGQRVWAYEGPKVVMDTLATTGVRGVSDYGTDFGPMKVLYTEHPHTMKSPWPKTSPFYYPDTVVQWTVFFTYSGESFHDASWEPDSQLGPGSQYDPSTRSHGCVHIPYGLAQWMFGWADVGTPIDIVPWNGKPVADQLALMTTDDRGNPLNPA